MRMRTLTASLAITLGLAVLGPSTALAQSAHVADAAQLDRLVASHASQEAADRQLIRDVLKRPQVRDVARRAGIDLDRADAAVGTLSGDELKDVARRAREVDNRLAGGGSNVTISTTTIIIALLVIILIIVAVN